MGTELGSVTISNTTAPDVVKNEYFDYARKVTIDDGGQPVETYASFRALVDGSITEVTAEMLEGATKIRSYAFYYCERLTSISIPEGVTTIGDYAFAYCKRLISVPIPDSVTSIGSNTFLSCKSLTSLTIPNSVTRIGWYAFENCSNLSSVKFIGQPPEIAYFKYCNKVVKYDFRGSTSIPSLAITSHLGHASGCQIVVPDSLYDNWQQATNWVALTDVVWVKASEYVEE